MPREERPTFKRLLEDLVERGDLVETRGNRFGLPDRMNLIVGRMVTNPRGFGFVVPDRAVEEVAGDIYIAGQQPESGDARRPRRRAPGAGQRRPRRGTNRARPRTRLRDDRRPFRPGRHRDIGFVVPFDRRLIMDVQIPSDEHLDAKPGDMVVVEITRWPTPTRGPLGRVIEVLGDINEPGVDNEIIIRKYGLPDEHSDEAIEEARRIGSEVNEKDLRNRTDFRPLVTVTIDGEHARDFDDAITLERLPNGNYWLGVHIADVAHYVQEGTALDEEAYDRDLGVFS